MLRSQAAFIFPSLSASDLTLTFSVVLRLWAGLNPSAASCSPAGSQISAGERELSPPGCMGPWDTPLAQWLLAQAMPRPGAVLFVPWRAAPLWQLLLFVLVRSSKNVSLHCLFHYDVGAAEIVSLNT